MLQSADHHPILREMCDLAVGGATVLENVTSAPVRRRFDFFVCKVVEQPAQVLARTDKRKQVWSLSHFWRCSTFHKNVLSKKLEKSIDVMLRAVKGTRSLSNRFSLGETETQEGRETLSFPKSALKA